MMYSNIKVLVVDDDENAMFLSCDALESFLPSENISKAYNVKTAIELLQNNYFNIAFLDIEMGENNGFDFSQYIKANYPEISVVFVTGHVDYGAKSYDFEPFDFLTKPINILRLEKTLSKYQKTQSNSNNERVGISADVGFVLVTVKDIKYIAREDNKVFVMMDNDMKYIVNYSIDKLETMFNEYNFIRVHQSYLVPMDKIVKVQSSLIGKTYQIRLTDGTMLPLSRGKYSTIKDILSKKGIKFI